MEPDEFKEMVKKVRLAEKALGKVHYNISEKEEVSRLHRRSIFVVEDIKKGEKFTEKNIRIIRPGQGLKPKFYDEVIGKMSSCDIKRGTPLSWNKVI